MLNLILLSDAATSLNAGAKPANIAKLFYSNTLNYSILTKHNLRDNERDLFARTLHVATKIFIPFDPKRLEIGGRSFFIEEFQFKDHLRDLLHLDPSMGDPTVLHDIRVLEALSRSPTLDPFIVAEYMRSEGLRVEPAFFAESYGLAGKASSDVFLVFQPLVQKALGKAASPEEMGRFVDQVWNVTTGTTDNLFLEALQIPRREWSNVIFSWKALIYYDLVSRGTADRLDSVLRVLKETTPKMRPSRVLTTRIEEMKRDLARNLYKLHEGSTGYIRQALTLVVEAILGDQSAGKLSETLRDMADHISAVGMNVVLFDQVTSYFLYLFPRPSDGIIDAEEFEAELTNLRDIVQLRDTAFG
ncbi:MAG: hypothetical protein P4L57_15010 [Rhizomicrobium sp.]|nr:hypothetical protein [Rhizomicrobium sp.]